MRRRRRALAVVEALCIGSGAAALLALARPGALLLPPSAWGPARLIARVWLVGAALVPFVLVVLPVWRRTGSLLGLARAVDDRVPLTRDSLFVAVDLTSPAASGRFTKPGQRELVERHLADAAARAGDVHPARLLPLSSLGRRSVAGPSLLALVLLAGGFGPDGLRVGWGRLFGPTQSDGQAEGSEAVEVVDLHLRNLRLELTPPAYSGRETLVLEGTTGDFQALAGTRVRLDAELGRGGSDAHIEWAGGQTWPATLDGSEVEAEFTVPGGGFWRVQLDRALGGSSGSRKFRVEVVPDRSPDLQIAAPAATELQPDAAMQIDASARDDFGLSRLELVVEQGGRALARQPMADVSGAATWDGRFEFVPREFLGERGGELELVVEAWDNDTVNGPKVTRSRAVEVYVPTARDHHQRVLALKQQLLDRAVDLLGAVLVDDDATRGVVESTQVLADHAGHAQALGALLELGGSLGDAMADDSFEQRSTFLGIGQLLENLARTWRPLDDLVAEGLRGGRRYLVDRGTLMKLAKRRGAFVDELERVVIDLDAFVSLHKGGDALERLTDLEPNTARLADLLRRAAEGKPVSAELAAAFDALQARLSELAQALAERSGGPDDGFLNRMPPNLAPDRMAQIQQAIEEGRFDDAMALLQEAMDAMAGMEEGLRREAQEQAGAQIAQEMRQKLQDGIDRAQELERQQEAVIEGTEQLQQRFGSGEGLDSAAIDELDRAIQDLRDRISDVPPDTLDGPDGGAVRSWERMALRQAMRLQEAWDEGALAQAAEHAEMTGADLNEMALELGKTSHGVAADNLAGQHKAQEARALAEDIGSRLDKSVRGAAQARQRAGTASQGLQGEQQAVAEGVARLRQDSTGLGGSAFNPAAGREQLEGAQQLMERAGTRLRQGRSGPALAAEQDALRQLQAYRQSLEGAKQAMEPGQGMGQGLGEGQPGGGSYARSQDWMGREQPNGEGGEVEMSDPDDFLTPEALRALLQEGAADDAPERYRPVNRGYYEELAR